MATFNETLMYTESEAIKYKENGFSGTDNEYRDYWIKELLDAAPLRNPGTAKVADLIIIKELWSDTTACKEWNRTRRSGACYHITEEGIRPTEAGNDRDTWDMMFGATVSKIAVGEIWYRTKNWINPSASTQTGPMYRRLFGISRYEIPNATGLGLKLDI